MPDLTPEEFAVATGRLAREIPDAIQVSIETALDELDTIIRDRIFNENKGISGASFGKYTSDAYKKYRESVGRQIIKKDLQLFGSAAAKTGLVGSFLINNRERQIEFRNKLEENKGRGQEKQLKMAIFEASEEEVDMAMSVIEDVFGQYITNIMGGDDTI